MEPPTNNQEIPPAGENGSGIDLYITVRDKDGVIVDQVCKEGDLYLWNWAVYIAGIMKCGFTDAAKTYYGFNTTGIQFANNGQVFDQSFWQGNGTAQLGSSVQPPTLMDTGAAVFVKSCVPSVPQVSSTGNTLKVIIPATASFASQTIISEACLVVYTYGVGAYTTITRDIFDAVTVPAGGSITVQFELWFNAMPA